MGYSLSPLTDISTGSSEFLAAAEIERDIATAIIEDALAAGFVISLYEGGGWAVKRADTLAAVLVALCSTDEDTLHFRRKDTGEKCGWVTLIWGNGWDLISDHVDNELMDRLVERAGKIADEASAKG